MLFNEGKQWNWEQGFNRISDEDICNNVRFVVEYDQIYEEVLK